MQWVYSENPPLFHMYNLAKLDACSEPRQIPKVGLFAIIAFNGIKSLTVLTKSSTSHSALNSSMQNVVHNEYHV